MASSRSKLAKLGVGTADPVDTLLRFADFDPGIRKELRTVEGTYGSFYKDTNLVREVRRTVFPTGSFEPTAAELQYLLGWGVGAGTGSPLVTYVPQVAVESRNIYWKPESGEQYFLPGVGVDTLTISASVGEPVAVSAEFVGTTYDDTRTNFPSLTPDVTTFPFVLSDLTATGGAFTTGGTTRQPNGVTIRVANHIDRGRFLDSLTLTRVQKLDQDFTISFDVPSGDNVGVWESGLATSVALAATFVNINTGAGFLVTAPAVHFPSQSARHARGGEGMVTIDGACYRSGGAGVPITFQLHLT